MSFVQEWLTTLMVWLFGFISILAAIEGFFKVSVFEHLAKIPYIGFVFLYPWITAAVLIALMILLWRGSFMQNFMIRILRPGQRQ